MTIERLNLPGGERVPAKMDVYDFADQLLVERASEIEVLEPGNYELTETIKAKDKPQLLTVFDDGTGMVRLVPETRRVFHERGYDVAQLKDQGRTIYLPAETGRICIAERTRILSRRYISDIIFWTPDDGEADDEMLDELRKILGGALVPQPA